MTKDSGEIIYWGISTLILIANVYYIATGPVNAVKTGRKLNQEQQKDNAKRNLFLTLFSLRGSPIHYDFVRGLNQIDIVFEDVPSVVQAWKNHRNSLDVKDQANAQRNWELERIQLLSAMAHSLGYSNINETDMMKDYYPEGHQNKEIADFEYRKQWSEYLKVNVEMNSLVIAQLKRNNTPPQEDIETKG